MAKIELTNQQLRLIQDALELYSRAGILQWRYVYDHPSVMRYLKDSFTPNKELKVGIDTMRGTVVEIGDGYVKTKGSWGNGEEIRTWTDVENIEISPDWNRYHNAKAEIERLFGEINRIILQDPTFSDSASPGIHNPKSREALTAFDLIQVIRHEFWKANENRSNITVDSSVSLNSTGPAIKVELDTLKETRKAKLDNLKQK